MLSTLPVECPAYLIERTSDLPALPTAVAGADTRLVLDTVRSAMRHGLMELILVGNERNIQTMAADMGWNISGIRIEGAADEQDAAKKAVALAASGEAAAIMKGNVHTDTLIRAVLASDVGLRTGRRLSHVFHMTVPGSDRLLCITDAVINVLPTLAEKMDIVHNAIELMHALGMAEPKIAILSGTERVTPAMPSSVDAQKIVAEADAGAFPRSVIAGPLAFDIAISAEAAKIKRHSSPVAGAADLLVVPNLETGNALFKQMVYFMSAAAAGIVLGARIPIMLTSRADPPPARLASAAIASLFVDAQND